MGRNQGVEISIKFQPFITRPECYDLLLNPSAIRAHLTSYDCPSHTLKSSDYCYLSLIITIIRIIIIMCWLTLLSELKGARSCNFRQFQHWLSAHKINWNNKITAQNYRRAQTKHRKAKKGQGWTKLERIEMDCIWVNLKNVCSSKILLSCYVAVILKMKDSCSANLTFRAHN